MPLQIGPLSLPITEWPFPLGVLMIVYVYTPILTSFFVGSVTPEGPALKSKSIVDACNGPILVTLGWILTYCTTLGTQALHTGTFLFGLASPNTVTLPQYFKVPERAMGNTLEQSPIFLLSFWLYVLFVDVATGVAFGKLYIISRFIYMIAYFVPGEFSILCEFGTQPGYSVTGNLCAGLLINAGGYGSYTAMLVSSNFSTITMAYFAMSFIIFPGLPFAPFLTPLHYFGHKSWERRQVSKAQQLQ